MIIEQRKNLFSYVLSLSKLLHRRFLWAFNKNLMQEALCTFIVPWFIHRIPGEIHFLVSLSHRSRGEGKWLIIYWDSRTYIVSATRVPYTRAFYLWKICPSLSKIYICIYVIFTYRKNNNKRWIFLSYFHRLKFIYAPIQ